MVEVLLAEWKTCPPAAASLRKLQQVVFSYLHVQETAGTDASERQPGEELEALLALGSEGRRLKIETPQQYLERMYGRTQ